MTTDRLGEQLRERTLRITGSIGETYRYIEEDADLDREAADRIDELEAEVERLRRYIYNENPTSAEEVAQHYLEGERQSYNSETFGEARLTSVITRARQDGAAHAKGIAEAAEAREAKLLVLVDDLHDESACSYDHHGYCQVHGWMVADPECPHKRARTALAETEKADD